MGWQQEWLRIMGQQIRRKAEAAGNQDAANRAGFWGNVGAGWWSVVNLQNIENQLAASNSRKVEDDLEDEDEDEEDGDGEYEEEEYEAEEEAGEYEAEEDGEFEAEEEAQDEEIEEDEWGDYDDQNQ